MLKTFIVTILVMWLSMLTELNTAFAAENPVSNEFNTQSSEVTHKIDVKPTARDNEIKNRIERILVATTWYQYPKVTVKDGVVFLSGETKTSEYKKWAESLAKNTQDVVAVVNQMDVTVASIGDTRDLIINGLNELWQQVLLSLPLVILSILILISSWMAAILATSVSRKYFNSREMHPLLSNVIARAVAILCFLLGIYFILRLLGLTTIALTILGGTGIMGIILGIAFKNITENLLASVLLSVQNPFENDDLIEVAGVTGYVQGLTIRATLLMTQDGYEVQIPNSVVYQNNIYNYTSNPNRRETFLIEITSSSSISNAQSLILSTLKKHPAILNNPEPLVLVKSLTAGNSVLCIYFWLDGSQYNWQKVRSSAIRLVKRAFQDAGIKLPGNEMKIIIENQSEHLTPESKNKKLKAHESLLTESKTTATKAEGKLISDTGNIHKQAQQSNINTKGQNLLVNSKTPTT